MAYPPRPLAFILAATDQGTFIVNRFDFHANAAGNVFGVGGTLLRTATYDQAEASQGAQLLQLRRQYHGDGVVALDCGANIGVFTLEWAKTMTGWGQVLAIEAQERVFYALAGNIAIANCFNAHAIHAAVTSEPGVIRIPELDHTAPASFGSLELRPAANVEPIGQPIDHSEARLRPVRALSIDSLELPRLDLLKIDVERMELEVLAGAARTIGRCLPVIVVEQLKTPAASLDAVLASHGYRRYAVGMNIVAVHPSDGVAAHVRAQNPPAG
jgi:FkbM family methyltransferase